MVNRSDPSQPAAQALSALMDGDLGPEAIAQACAQWRHDPQLRQRWHAYQLIGDVLRSDDLANAPQRDEAFLQALRGRLAQEPVPLAPQAMDERPIAPEAGAGVVNGKLAGSTGRVWGGWMAPAAVAAGFVAVAGVVLVTRVMAPVSAPEAVLAAAPQGSAAASGTLVRDAGLDRYLQAHRKLGNGLAAAGAAEHRVQIVFEGR